MPALPTTRPLARFAQTLASAFLQTIAAGRLAAIVTVFRQLILQLLNQRLLRGYLFLQPSHLLTQRLDQR